jgi:hypothetical protein
LLSFKVDDLSFASVRFEFPPDTQYHGSYVSYYNNDNGQLCRKGHYKDGPWVGYKRDGTVDEEITGTFKNGVKVD